MEKSDIHLSDIGRVLFGEVPGSFYLELVLRAIIVYFLLLT